MHCILLIQDFIVFSWDYLLYNIKNIWVIPGLVPANLRLIRYYSKIHIKSEQKIIQTTSMITLPFLASKSLSSFD